MGAYPVQVKPNFQFPVLGITIDLTNRWHQLKKEIVDQIASLTVPLVRKRQSIKTKRLAFQMVVIPSIVYKSKFLNLSLTHLKALFAPLGRFIKSLYKLKVAVPKILLHTPTQRGGLGIPDILEIVHKQKLGMLCRASTHASPAAQASKAIMDRAIRQQGLFETSGMGIQYDEHL